MQLSTASGRHVGKLMFFIQCCILFIDQPELYSRDSARVLTMPDLPLIKLTFLLQLSCLLSTSGYALLLTSQHLQKSHNKLNCTCTK
ncbi:hypothetical protein Y1Q_0015428 [Alligator mississippiensis]|uniref:Uncharacterized protein n=1 Tax=Alligator mississippiensis TaxID=8496 RepID=A0A151NCV4_ALLMI|nr:hypothetical protein Y1Q_0015428 [Alligator mississippiensis]